MAQVPDWGRKEDIIQAKCFPDLGNPLKKALNSFYRILSLETLKGTPWAEKK